MASGGEAMAKLDETTDGEPAGPEHIKMRFRDPGPKRMLALDGGGVRGAITIELLARLEAHLAERMTAKGFYDRPSDFRLCDFYDVIGGTSVGALLAAELALGARVDDLRAQFHADAPRILQPHPSFRLTFGLSQMFRTKFSDRNATTQFRARVGERTLGSPDLRTGLVVIAKNYTTGSVWALMNNPFGKFYHRDPDKNPLIERVVRGNSEYALWQILRGTSAAPAFFSPMKIQNAEGPRGAREDHVMVDGGVSPHNSPALQLLMMAGINGYNFSGRPKGQERAWSISADDLLISSVGVGAQKTVNHKVSSLPVLQAVNALRTTMRDGAELATTMLYWLSEAPIGRERPPVDRMVENLDGESVSAFFRGRASFARYDASLEEGLAKTKIRSRVWPPRKWLSRWRRAALLDFSERRSLKDLAEIGAAAAEDLTDDTLRADIPDRFLTNPRPAIAAFEGATRAEVRAMKEALNMVPGPKLSIAVTGHRPNRLRIPMSALRADIDELLRALDGGATGPALDRFEAVSALAEGSDRAFAAAARARGWRVKALLPFAVDDYKKTFADASTTPDFDDLLSTSAEQVILPGRLSNANDGYAAVGAAALAAADAVLTIWDGQPAAGRGGTPEIIAEAVRSGKPVLWIHAGGGAPLKALRIDRAGASGEPIDVQGVAARAETISPHAAAVWVRSRARP